MPDTTTHRDLFSLKEMLWNAAFTVDITEAELGSLIDMITTLEHSEYVPDDDDEEDADD